MAVGVAPETAFVDGVERTPDGGIVVDDRLRAAPGLWAAGDVAAWPDPLTGVRHRVEHWVHAQKQGRVAGCNMAGGAETFSEITSYDTELFGIRVQVFGTPGLADAWRTEGLAPDGLAWGSRDGRLLAAYRIGNTIFDSQQVQQILGRG